MIASTASNNANTHPNRAEDDVSPSAMASLDDPQTEDIHNTYETQSREDVIEEETEQGHVDFSDHPSGGDVSLASQQEPTGGQLHTRLREEEMQQVEHDGSRTKHINYDEDLEIGLPMELDLEKAVQPVKEAPATSEKQTTQIIGDQEEETDDREKEDVDEKEDADEKENEGEEDDEEMIMAAEDDDESDGDEVMEFE